MQTLIHQKAIETPEVKNHSKNLGNSDYNSLTIDNLSIIFPLILSVSMTPISTF
jgi:hypothetical protein